MNSISFLVPTLGNRPVEIRRLFDSFCTQSEKSFDVILVVQDNYDLMQQLVNEYKERIPINIVNSEEKGLSKARNKGLCYCTGCIIVLSDDDCWYPNDAVTKIISQFEHNHTDVLLTQIFDKKGSKEYKAYKKEAKIIKSSFDLMSRSSIEIAFSSRFKEVKFDERFGLGAKYICCEEVDYLLQIYKNNARIKYAPIITVFHDKKYNGSTNAQVIAKGAIYAKHFNIVVGVLICAKDYVLYRENNFSHFFKGYREFKKYDDK